MKTANQIREEMKQAEQRKIEQIKQRAVEYCDTFVAIAVEDTAKFGGTRIDLCATEFDHRTIKYVYDYLCENGYEVRLNGSNFFTIQW